MKNIVTMKNRHEIKVQIPGNQNELWPDRDIQSNEKEDYRRNLLNIRTNISALAEEMKFNSMSNFQNRQEVLADVFFFSKAYVKNNYNCPTCVGVSVCSHAEESIVHLGLRNGPKEAVLKIIKYGGAKLLLQRFIDPVLRDATLFHIAALRGRRPICKLIMDVLCPRDRKKIFQMSSQGTVFVTELCGSTTPLTAAVWSGDPDLLEDLLLYGAEPDALDPCSGNSVMHTIVKCNILDKEVSKKMCDLLLHGKAVQKWWSNKHSLPMPLSMVQIRDMQKYLVHLDNEEGHSTATYAILEGQYHTFSELMNLEGQYKYTQFNLGPVESSLYDITEIDCVKSNKNGPSAVEIIAYNQDDRSSRLLEEEPLHTLCEKKWRRCRPILYMWGIYHLFIMTIFSVITNNRFAISADGKYDSLIFFCSPQMILDERSWVRVVVCGQILVAATAVMYLLGQISDIIRAIVSICKHKEKHCSSIYKVPLKIVLPFDFYDVVSLIFSGGTIASCAFCKIDTRFVCPALICGWYYTLSFAVCFQNLGHYAIAIHRILFTDAARFAVVFLIITVGYAIGNMTLYNVGGNVPVDFENLFYSLFTMFRLFSGLKDIGNFKDASHPVAAMIIYVLFVVSTTLLLLNMLIATMSDTYSKLMENQIAVWKAHRLRFCLLLERRVPRCMLLSRIGYKHMETHQGDDRWFLAVTCVTNRKKNYQQKQDGGSSKSDHLSSQNSDTSLKNIHEMSIFSTNVPFDQQHNKDLKRAEYLSSSCSEKSSRLSIEKEPYGSLGSFENGSVHISHPMDPPHNLEPQSPGFEQNNKTTTICNIEFTTSNSHRISELSKGENEVSIKL